MDAQKFNSLLKKIKYNKRAVAAIYAEYYLPLKLHLQRKFGNLINAEDSVQDVFLKLMEMDQTDYVEFPATWINELGYNCIIDQLRAKLKNIEEVPLSEDIDSDFEVEKTVLNLDLQNAFRNLEPTMQKILYLHFWEGYELQVLAERFQINYGNLRVKVSRAYQILRIYLK